jgi:Protein of unknown function (DUF742)
MASSGEMGSSGEQWVDDKAGPVVRPYALVRGRTRASGADFDLVAMVTVARRTRPDVSFLEPEHLRLLCLCPASVADLAARLILPVGVVKVMLADLRNQGFILVHRPVEPAQLPDVALLRRVADGLRRL